MGKSIRSIFSFSFARTFLVLVLLAFLAACSSSSTLKTPDTNTDITSASAPEGFAYATTQSPTLNISTKDLYGQAITNSVVSIYYNYDLSQNNKGQLLLQALTDDDGKLVTNLTLPSDVKTVLVVLDTVGIANVLEVSVSTNMSASFAPAKRPSIDTSSLTSQGLETQLYSYKTLGSWTGTNGLPYYLTQAFPTSPSQRILDLIKSSFPEAKSVLEHHPSFLLNDPQVDLVLTKDSEVTLTFLHEGADYKNTFAYYTYPVGNPPTKLSDIKDLTIAFPNVSYTNSGGALISGDSIVLKYAAGTDKESKTFPKGTAIGWAIVADGWVTPSKTVTGGVTDGNASFYSVKSLNADLLQHMIVLYDATDKVFLMGIEDSNRNLTSTDNDFNDNIFQVKLSDPSAVATDSFIAADTGALPDKDGDGVSDIYDAYPTDPSKAFNEYFPSQNGYSTLAFEDRWPVAGDYDFNDLVVDYRINQVMNASNKIVELQTEFKFRAAGAAYSNAFAFELPIPFSKVASVTGEKFADPTGSFNYIKRNANGTEAKQTNAVIFATDDVGKLLGYLVNTDKKTNVVAKPQTVSMTIKFSEPQDKALFVAPYNPFIVTNLDNISIQATGSERALQRGREIHLPNFAPTKLADMSLFGTQDDQSKPDKGQWYVTKNNKLPWALNIPESFDYLSEKNQISAGYTHFIQWVNTGGNQYPDWYKNKEGYRNTSAIY